MPDRTPSTRTYVDYLKSLEALTSKRVSRLLANTAAKTDDTDEKHAHLLASSLLRDEPDANVIAALAASAITLAAVASPGKAATWTAATRAHISNNLNRKN